MTETAKEPRLIYYYSPKIHTYMKTILDNPPAGYKFIAQEEDAKRKKIDYFRDSKFFSFIYKKIIKKMFNVYGMVNKTYSRVSPPEADLVLSTSSIITENKPWIMEILDSPLSLAGNDLNLFLKNKEEISRGLLSENCKKIIVHTRACYNALAEHFSNEVMKKTIILAPAKTELKAEKMKKNNNEVQFLFMGSINNPQEFVMKGGLIAIEAFKELEKRYSNIKLVLRCALPENFKEKYDLKNSKSILLVENKIPYEELEKIYLDSDMLISPGTNYFIGIFLEAMNYSLPIAALDTYGVDEFVFDSINGFVIKAPEGSPYKDKSNAYGNPRSDDFLKKLEVVDSRIIEEFVKKLSGFVESKEIRERMSKEALEVFRKNFVLEDRNKKFREILDEIFR